MNRNFIYSYLNIIVNIASNFLVVYLLVLHYGHDVFAVTVIIQSILVYLETLNLGLYTSNRVYLSKTSNKSLYFVKSVILGFKIPFILVVFIGLIYFGFEEEFLSSVFHDISDELYNSTKSIILMSLIYILLKIPFTIALSAFGGRNDVHIEKNYLTLLVVIKIVALSISIFTESSIVSYFAIYFVISLLALLISNMHYYNRYLSGKLYGMLNSRNRISNKYVLMSSYGFFLSSISAAVIWATDSFLVSYFLNLKDVAIYNINFSLYNGTYLFVTIIGGILISSFGRLLRKKDFSSLEKQTNHALILSYIIAFTFLIGGLLFTNEIISLWVGSEYYGGYGLIVVFSIYGLLLSVSSILTSIMILTFSPKGIIIMSLSEAIVKIFLSVLLGQYYGAIGIALGTIIAITLAVILPIVIFINNSRKLLFNISFKFHIIFTTIFLPFIGFIIYYPITFVVKIVLFFMYIFLVSQFVRIGHKELYSRITSTLKL